MFECENEQALSLLSKCHQFFYYIVGIGQLYPNRVAKVQLINHTVAEVGLGVLLIVFMTYQNPT